jgi:hypothetical protein
LRKNTAIFGAQEWRITGRVRKKARKPRSCFRFSSFN